MQDDCGGLDEVLIELPGCGLVLGSRFEATDAFLHIFSIERFRITCTHPGCPRTEQMIEARQDVTGAGWDVLTVCSRGSLPRSSQRWKYSSMCFTHSLIFADELSRSG